MASHEGPEGALWDQGLALASRSWQPVPYPLCHPSTEPCAGSATTGKSSPPALHLTRHQCKGNAQPGPGRLQRQHKPLRVCTSQHRVQAGAPSLGTPPSDVHAVRMDTQTAGKWLRPAEVHEGRGAVTSLLLSWETGGVGGRGWGDAIWKCAAGPIKPPSTSSH